ncbi:MAG TPA: radical SAM protein [Acidobacteriota bacterium]|nr:radical SAM protein [Acidobacteriota bacterium]HNT17186.1 radical SAM protein [Acidobacteriota bacterium]HPA27608.1 radical SAM protein [Acidobacteriota bacterium]HQO20822.1 radical SAM protein [Acidobacteriota bacterium]HQQ47702.1 radical SAM protein [Acidobacteriota bacterium]
MKGELLPLQKGIIYGPVRSRRLGNSLGVNISPAEIKFCSLNCSYCQYSWTGLPSSDGERFRELLPAAAEIAARVKEALTAASAKRIRIDNITFSGNGEPTLHPDFPEIVVMVSKLRDSLAPGAKTACLSNSTTIADERILGALEKIDEPFMKLDAGSEGMFEMMNRPSGKIALEKIIEGLVKLGGRATIQSMFTRGAVDNSGDDALPPYIAALKRIRPKGVQIYTLDRIPADGRLLPVTKRRLEEIRKIIETEAKLPAVVYI